MPLLLRGFKFLQITIATSTNNFILPDIFVIVFIFFIWLLNSLVDNEDHFKRILAFHGPVTAAVDAITWQDYLGGIIQFHCDDHVNHAVR